MSVIGENQTIPICFCQQKFRYHYSGHLFRFDREYRLGIVKGFANSVWLSNKLLTFREPAKHKSSKGPMFPTINERIVLKQRELLVSQKTRKIRVTRFLQCRYGLGSEWERREEGSKVTPFESEPSFRDSRVHI